MIAAARGAPVRGPGNIQENRSGRVSRGTLWRKLLNLGRSGAGRTIVHTPS
ncbi:hypothetical protein EES37_30085 [Streptomyces sp. ADI91-18]|nr:hypothetical protein EES37_30085 [Streptomyces sp. ADI91-18]